MKSAAWALALAGNLAIPTAAARGAGPSLITPETRLPAPISGRAFDHDWPKYCADAGMTGQAHHETAISTSTVAGLRLAWKVSFPGAVASSATVVAGRVYVGDWAGNEWALDAATGAVVASVNLGTTLAAVCAPPLLGITSAPAFDRGKLFLAGGDDSFYALDPETLRPVWKTKLGDNSPAGGYYGWCSPSPVGGRIYQGVSSNCDSPFVGGRVVMLDAASGAVAGSVDLSQTSDPSRFGSGVWTSPAIDAASRDVFVTTASAYAYEDGLAYSVVRLSPDDLEIEDSWKIPLADYQATPDADWGSSPTLFRDAAGRALVGAGHKDGSYYAFRRDSLAQGPVWKTRVALGGGCPVCGLGSISTAAYDGERLYVGGGKPPAGGQIVRPKGAVTALDPATGTEKWHFYAYSGPVLAPVSEANGVVFAAAGDVCVALDASTGVLLWSQQATSDIYGGVAISDGRVFFGDTNGNFCAFEAPRPPA